MKIFDKLFGSKNDKIVTAHFKLFKGAFPKGADFTDCKVYHIKSFEYTDANMELYEKHKFEKNFYQVLDKLKYNSQTNDVGLYYVIDSEDKGVAYLISDSFDPWEKEYIMEKYEWTFDKNIMGLSTVEKIN